MIPYNRYSSQKETLEKLRGKEKPKKREEVRFPEVVSGRKPVVILFLGTILLSAFFWLKGGIDWKGFNFFSSETITFEKKEEEREGESLWDFNTQLDLLAAIKTETTLLKGTYGIYVKELETGEEFGLSEDEEFMAASVNKLPVLLYFYKKVEEGDLSKDQEYVLLKEDVQDYGTGSMRYDSLGKVYSYEDLARLSMKKSDNTANFVLTKILGRKNIQAWLDDLGLEKTLLVDNLTTPEETGWLLEWLYKGEIVGEEYEEEIFDFLTKTDFEDRLPKDLPESVRVAHKIGNEVGVINDCGVVFERNPYVICILTKQVRESEAKAVLPLISRMVWEWERKQEM